MELYELTLHFPDTYGSLNKEELTLTNTEYYDSPEKAISRAQVIASAFVAPRPDFWYVADGAGFSIWTDSPAEVKQAIHYELLTSKPDIKPVTLTAAPQ